MPDLTLPPLDFDGNGELVIPGLDFSSQRSKLSSQLSPLDHSSNSPANAPFVNLNIRHSSSQGSIHLASPFDIENHIQNDDGLFPMAFGEEEDLPFAEFPIRIDAEGNLIEEPELPAYPSHGDKNDDAVQEDLLGAHLPDDGGLTILGDEDAQEVFGYDEVQRPLVDRIEQNTPQNHDVRVPSEEPLSSEPVHQELQLQRSQRRQRKLKTLGPDATTQVGRSDFKAWTESYLARTQEDNNSPQQVTAAQARKNAYNLVFGTGLGGVGVLNGISGLNHELAQFFAADNLEELVMGNVLTEIVIGDEKNAEEDASGNRRRRSASVAFGSEDDAEDEDGRRVRARTGEGDHEQYQQDGHSQRDAQIVDDATVMFDNDQDLLPEIGREHPGSALSDHRRSSNAPWNRRPSMVSSSARSGKHIDVDRNAVERSPLGGGGSILQSDVKFSDAGIPALGSDGFAPFQNDGTNDLSSFGEFDVTAGVSTEANTSQFMREALDREGRNFLGFVERVAADRGEYDVHNKSLRWVEFGGLLDAQDKTRAVVAQAFLHVLTLATKDQVRVEQAGAEMKEPFGEIYVGVMSALQAELVGDVDVVGVEKTEYVEIGEEIDGAGLDGEIAE